MESALQVAESRCGTLEGELASSHAHTHTLTAQLASLTESLEDIKQAKRLLEGVDEDRLGDITALQRQLDEERLREGLVGELGEQIASLESQLTGLQNKVDPYSNLVSCYCV